MQLKHRMFTFATFNKCILNTGYPLAFNKDTVPFATDKSSNCVLSACRDFNLVSKNNGLKKKHYAFVLHEKVVFRVHVLFEINSLFCITERAFD